ncbi:MAG: oxidoreductase, partial [Trueperella sp.]|nr:oxidoreductase [Trueperella sp.]
DFWSVSSGGNLPVKVHTGAGYQVPFSRRIKDEVGTVTGVAGLIANANQAAVVVHEENADVVYIGRVALHDPYVPRHWAQQLDEDIPWPNQYLRGVSER